MKNLLLITGLLLFALVTLPVLAQEPTMIIHTTNQGDIEIPLASIEGITFDLNEPQAGEERDFPLGDTGLNITMVWIPAGSFMMGRLNDEQYSYSNEDPRHEVTIGYGFWMGKYEVTQALWEAVMGSNPSFGYGVGDNYPVYSVSWNDIQEFESRLNNIYRLPSESEWEYACRAGTATRFYWGDDPDYAETGNYAWYFDNSSFSTHPVGVKLPNEWGLYDMSGNVWEWVEDRYHDSYNGAPDDGSAWVEGGGESRILRGGSWDSSGGICRSAIRGRLVPDAHDGYFLEFRLVLVR